MKRALTVMVVTLVQGATAIAQPADPADPADPDPATEPAPSPTPPPPRAPAETPVNGVEHAEPPAPTPVPPKAAVPRLRLELELFTSARWLRRVGADLTELRLDRGEAGADIGLSSRISAGLRVEAIRSAGEGGALGIDGDSLVLRIKRAQIAGEIDAGSVHLEGAAGIVADPWIAVLDDDYTLRPLSASASERLLGWNTSDLAIRARARLGPASLAVSIGNGEGLRYPERNSGKSTTAVLEVVALDHHDARVKLSAMVREGSVGPASIRDRRVGGSVSVVSPWLRGAGELAHAWGVGDRGDVVATVVGGWAEGRIADHLFVGLRGATIGYPEGRSSTVGGALAIEAPRQTPGRVRLWLAIDHTTASGAGAPLPGSDTGDATTFLLIASATAPFVVE